MLLLVALFATPLLAEPTTPNSLQRAVVGMALWNFTGMIHDATAGLEPSAIVLDDATRGGNSEVMEHYVSKNFGRVIAEELVSSYQANEQRSDCVPTSQDDPIVVTRLDAFRLTDGAYDWERLNRRFPDVRAVVRVSKPALDSTSTYAVVRYEVVTDAGFAWGAFEEFEHQPDGSWAGLRGIVGDIRVIGDW